MPEKLITNSDEFQQLCEHIRKVGLVAFDTEFVSEYTLHPELSLLQFATHERCVAVDPLAISDRSCWWEIMADEETRVIVHGGQAEIRFCLKEFQQPPRNMIDLQIAEGLRSRSYPLGYATLVQRVINKQPHSKETRTDWKKRPLTPQQVKYALDDVAYVLPVWKKQQKSLKTYGRLDWVFLECDRLIADIVIETERPRWERISGIHKLDQKTLGVVREISNWRDSHAEDRNRPLRQILRDDLVIELARMKPDTIEELQSIRDMTRRSYQRIAPELLKAIQKGVQLEKHELPEKPSLPHIEKSNNEQVICQLLGIALSNRCAEMKIARQLVGTNTDLMQLIRHHNSKGNSKCDARLSEGWRAEVCGNLMTDVLNGQVSMRVAKEGSEFPLVFERVNTQD